MGTQEQNIYRERKEEVNPWLIMKTLIADLIMSLVKRILGGNYWVQF